MKRLARRLRPLAPVVAIAAALALLPFNTCILLRVTGYPCPGCGFTRAALALLRGDLAASLRYHPLALPGAVLLAVTVALAVALPDEHPLWARWVRYALNASAVALVVAWVARVALGWRG